MKSTCRQHLFALILIAGLGLAAYANSFDASFHFDDYTYIVNKKEIRDLGDIQAIYRALGHPSRFITFLTFAVNYHFHRFDVFGYHLVNWLIHLVNSGLVYWLVLLIGQSPKIKEEQRPVGIYHLALFSGLLYMVHPVQTEAVTYIVQRFTSLATLFYLSAVCFYLKGRLSGGKNQGIYYGGFCAAAVLGMFTKQICFTIPVMILWIEWLLFDSGVTSLLRKRWKILLVLGLLLLVIPSFFGFNPPGIIGREFPSRSHTGDIINTQTYFLTQSRVIPTYIRLLFFPAGQTLDYDFSVSKSLFEPKVILGFSFLFALLCAAAGCIRRHRWVAFGIGWFFITLSVTSSIIPIPHVIFEHHMYLPAVGFVIVLNFLIAAIVRKQKYFMGVMGGIVLIFSVLTFQRNEVWRTDISLWTDIVRKAPDKVRVWNNLGLAYLEQGAYEKSIACFDRSLSMNEGEARVYNNRGLAYAALGRDKEALADYDRAVYLYRRNKEFFPELGKKVWAEIFINRGSLYVKHQRFVQALEDFRAADAIDPENPRILYNLGYVHERSKEFDPAREYYELASQADPAFIKPLIGLGFVYHEQGNNEQAVIYYNKAIALDPRNGEAFFYRAIVYAQLGRNNDAQADMKRSMEYGFEAQSEELRQVRSIILNVD